MKQRGFGLILYLVLAVAILGALAGIARAIYVAGGDAVRLEWAEANRKAAEEAERERLAREAESRKHVAALQKAEREARTYAERWRQARQALPLALECPTGPENSPRNDATGEGGATPSTRLTYGFLRLYDGAWTGSKGEPVFGDPSRAPETAPPPGAPSARGLGDVLDVHAENARRCDENARQLGALVNLINRLREGAQ